MGLTNGWQAADQFTVTKKKIKTENKKNKKIKTSKITFIRKNKRKNMKYHKELNNPNKKIIKTEKKRQKLSRPKNSPT